MDRTINEFSSVKNYYLLLSFRKSSLSPDELSGQGVRRPRSGDWVLILVKTCVLALSVIYLLGVMMLPILCTFTNGHQVQRPFGEGE